MATASRKYFWLGLVFVFLIGLIGGAYFVLRSTVTHGELANSTPLAQGKSSDELLQELLQLNQKENTSPNTPPEDKNITEDFFQKIMAKTGLSKKTAEEISSNDFMVATVLPYLKSNQLTLLPLIPDSVLKIVPDSKVNSQKYFKDTNKDMVVFFNNVKKFSKLDPEKVTDTHTLADLENSVVDLGTAFENMSHVSVPKKHIELQKKIMISVFSLQKMMEAIIKSETDPLKSLLVMNEAQTLGKFWQGTLYDYVDYKGPRNSQ